MDILTHILLGLNLSSIASTTSGKTAIVICSILPDIGEILIQQKLKEKYNTKLGVYDVRTSDRDIASNKSVTWLYDVLHSPITYIFSILLFYHFKYSLLLFFSIGGLSHIFLDFATHGKVWALKLMFPMSNARFPCLENKLGNWWEWTPSVTLFNIKIPITCISSWAILLTLLLINLLIK